jgi:hypothetical protein
MNFMDGDFIEVKKKADSDEYIIRIYFAEFESEVSISFHEPDFIKFLNESVRVVNNTSNKYVLRVPDDIYSLVDEYGVNQILKIKDKSQRLKRKKTEAEVVIYIPDEIVSLTTAENITNTAGEFMETLGFILHTEDEPGMGSFFKKLKFIFSKTIGSEDLETLYQKGKKALELKYVELPTAEQTEKLASAAERLITSLNQVNEGVIRCGTLLVLKRTVDNEPKIIVHQLSTEMIILLDKHPKLIFSPNTIYELITGDVKSVISDEGPKDQIAIH